jgi:hypothetical protein
MAKTIEEIFKELNEWVDENPERSVMIIAGAEEKDIFVKQKGKKKRSSHMCGISNGKQP